MPLNWKEKVTATVNPLLTEAGKLYFELQKDKERKQQLKQREKALELESHSVANQIRRTKLDELRTNWDIAMAIYKQRHPEGPSEYEKSQTALNYARIADLERPKEDETEPYDFDKIRKIGQVRVEAAQPYYDMISDAFDKARLGKNIEPFIMAGIRLREDQKKIESMTTKVWNDIRGGSETIRGGQDYYNLRRMYDKMTDYLREKGLVTHAGPIASQPPTTGGGGMYRPPATTQVPMMQAQGPGLATGSIEAKKAEGKQQVITLYQQMQGTGDVLAQAVKVGQDYGLSPDEVADILFNQGYRLTD